MATLLTMPGVAANSTEAALSAWVVEVNQPFSAGDPIVTIETDKAVVDVEAEADGVILRTLVEPGTSVEVGQPIAVLGVAGETVPDVDALLTELGVSTAVAAPAASPSTGDAAQVTGPASAGSAPAAGAGPSGARLFASPIARRLAREAGLALESLQGSGPNGRIVRRDVERALATAPARPAPSAPAPATPQPAAQSAAPAGAVVEVPHSRMRRAIAARLSESKQTIPHFYVRGTADVERLVSARERINARGRVKVSINDLLLKAVATAHMAEPDMNVVWTPEAVLRHSSVDIAVAIATDRGLVTPVLRAVESLSLTQIATTVRDFAERAADGRLRQDELEGGTISVSNLGMFGTEDFSAIINPPQSSILAVGAVRREPVVRGEELVVGSTMRVTLSVDHRPIDGVVAARWMRTFLALLEDPVQMLV